MTRRASEMRRPLLLRLLGCLGVAASLRSIVALSSPFPSEMLWGASTAAYQIEGSWNVSKQLSIWDVKTHNCGGCIAHNDTGDVAADSYVRFEEDTLLVANLSLNAYRFSIAWPRIITEEGDVNEVGVQHYNRLIDGLLDAGITPLVTLFHQDLPYAYSVDPAGVELRGWSNATYLVPLFVRYATACFEAFGDRVKHWITINEPRYLGDPYVAGHTAILAHVHTVAAYRAMQGQDGVIGMVIDGAFSIPNTRRPADADAAERAMIFNVGLFGDPLFFGDYPQVLKQRLGSRLQRFTEAEKKLLRDNVPDVFYLNHYTSNVARNDTNGTCGETGVCQSPNYANGTQIGAQAEVSTATHTLTAPQRQSTIGLPLTLPCMRFVFGCVVAVAVRVSSRHPQDAQLGVHALPPPNVRHGKRRRRAQRVQPHHSRGARGPVPR